MRNSRRQTFGWDEGGHATPRHDEEDYLSEKLETMELEEEPSRALLREDPADKLNISKIIEEYNLDPNYKNMKGNNSYGYLVKLQFCREQMEKKLHINRSPKINTVGTVSVASLAAVLSIVHLVLILTWMRGGESSDADAGQKMVDDVDLVALVMMAKGNDSGLAGNISRTAWTREVARVYGPHLMMNSLCFTLFLPQVFLFKILLYSVNLNSRLASEAALKTCAYATFFVSWFQCPKGLGLGSSGVHRISSATAIFFMVGYAAVLALRLVGWIWPRLYQLRCFGFLFRRFNTASFSEAVTHVLNMAGLVAVFTGYLVFIRLSCWPLGRNRPPFDVSSDEDWAALNRESALILSLCLTHVSIHVIVEICVLWRHKKKYHENCLTFHDFIEYNFAKFADVFEAEDITKMGEPMPKVTTPRRML